MGSFWALGAFGTWELLAGGLFMELLFWGLLAGRSFQVGRFFWGAYVHGLGSRGQH